jgi:hypothetical protein
MPAHHKTSTKGVGLKLDPHAGPTVGDRSFEFYFTSPMAFQEAMQKAKELEKRGMYRRAWRVRLNLDGEQPVYAPPRPDGIPAELTEAEKKELRRKKKRLNELRLKADKLAEELEEHNHE